MTLLQAELYQRIIEELVRSKPVQIAACNIQCARARRRIHKNPGGRGKKGVVDNDKSGRTALQDLLVAEPLI